MHTVKIAGSDLNYFREIVGNALRGSYGAVDEVTLDVHDDGRISLSLNEVASSRFGAPSGPLEPAGNVDAPSGNMNVNMGFGQEGHGNPYANVSEEDHTDHVHVSGNGHKPLKNRDRIALLESEIQRLWGVVSNAEERLGVRLIPAQG